MKAFKTSACSDTRIATGNGHALNHTTLQHDATDSVSFYVDGEMASFSLRAPRTLHSSAHEHEANPKADSIHVVILVVDSHRLVPIKSSPPPLKSHRRPAPPPCTPAVQQSVSPWEGGDNLSRRWVAAAGMSCGVVLFTSSSTRWNSARPTASAAMAAKRLQSTFSGSNLSASHQEVRWLRLHPKPSKCARNSSLGTCKALA